MTNKQPSVEEQKAEIIKWMNAYIPDGKTVPSFEDMVDNLLATERQMQEEVRKEAVEEERVRILKSVNDKEKQEQILATLLLKVGNEGDDIVIADSELITNDWIVFEKRNIENMKTIYKVVRNQTLTQPQ